nr:MogA/MoaB family molybdenum cofactor biosynthesis protein [Actinomycetales bacterium]
MSDPSPSDGVTGTVITVSDRVSAGTREDRSGPLAVTLLADHGVVCAPPVVVPDEVEAIRTAIRVAVAAGSAVVVTTGGTGISPRDVTPDAVAPLLRAELTGVAEQIRRRGLESTPLAGLSRGLVGVTEDAPALVVCAPGSSGGVRDSLEVVGPLIGHILDQLAGGDH